MDAHRPPECPGAAGHRSPLNPVLEQTFPLSREAARTGASSSVMDEKPSEKGHARANRLTISRLIAT